jgi:hypothetical protein
MEEKAMSGVNWGHLEAIPAGKKRNTVIIAAVVAFLSERRKDDAVLTTLEFAHMLCPENASAMGKVLVRLAPELPSYATHDGGSGQSYGKTFVRWRWHGVK